LMKAAGFAGIRPRKRWTTTIRIPGITPATDLVNRDFKAERPNVLPAHRRGLAVPGRGPGHLLPADRRLVDGHQHAFKPRRGRPEDGTRASASRAWADPPLRPGRAGRIQAVVAALDRVCGSGRRSLAGSRAWTRPWRRGCRRSLASGGFERVAGCGRPRSAPRCRGVTCRSREREEIAIFRAGRLWGAGDRAPAGSLAVDDLSRAAP
jgi:hypothetical protein